MTSPGESTVSGASSSRQRGRKTKAETAAFNDAIWEICAINQPLSARQCYYRAVVAGLVDKDTAGSRKNEQMIGHALEVMRERGVAQYDFDTPPPMEEPWVLRSMGIIPFEWITDNTRTRFQADLHDSKTDALADMARYYRRDLWRSQPQHVEVWSESDSIGGVLMDVTDEYGVALLPCRGQSSKRFIWDSAQSYQRLGKPVVCLYVGDFDPAGLDIGQSVEDRLERYGAEDVEFIRLAVTPEQVLDLDLPGHGLNPKHPAPVLERFIDECDSYGIPREAVEAEALPPDDLRQLVQDAIEGYIDQRQWEIELAVEQQERQGLAALALADMQDGGQ